MTYNSNNRKPITAFSRNLLTGAVTAALMGSAISYAQEEEKRGGYSLQLEEVVVTAQKREQDFMDVPVSVNAFTAQDMINTGAASIQDIDAFMPGVEISDTDSGTTQNGITVRGVNSPGIGSGQDSSVATFYDGAYMPRAVTSIPFTDIARTEVLKGPQGTLFGRNATAGVVNIVPNKPHQEFEGFVKTRLGSDSLVRVEGMINVPVSDTVALRGNIFSLQKDGETSSVAGGDDFRDQGFMAARGVMLWDVSEDTELRIALDYEDRDEMPRAAIGVGDYAYQSSDDPFRGKDLHDVTGRGNPYGKSREEEKREQYGISAQIDHTINDELSLFGIVSYRDWETTNLQEEDGTADIRRYVDSNNIEESDIFYTEFRLNYIDDKIDLILGANYSEEEVFQRTDVGIMVDSYMQFLSLQLLPEFGMEVDFDSHVWDIFPDSPDAFYEVLSGLAETGVLPPRFTETYYTETMDNTGDFVNWGIFADATYQLTDTVRVAGGLRYSYDEKEYTWQTHPYGIDWSVPLTRIVYNPAETGTDPEEWFNEFSDKDDWDKITGRLVVDWSFSDTAMAYFTAGTGYKSGGFNGQTFSGWVAGSFDPEDMTSYEIGVKGDFFDDRFRAEVGIFYYELDGRQRGVDTKDGPDDPVATPSIVSSDDEGEGIEIILTWQVIDTVRLTGLTTYREVDSISDEYYNSQGKLTGGESNTSRTNNTYTLKLDWAPEISVGYLLFHMNYEFAEDTGKFDPDTAVFVNGPWYFQDKKRLNARVAWSNEADNIEVALWGNNLLDEEYAGNPGGRASDLGAYHTRPEQALTWGVDLRYSF